MEPPQDHDDDHTSIPVDWDDQALDSMSIMSVATVSTGRMSSQGATWKQALHITTNSGFGPAGAPRSLRYKGVREGRERGLGLPKGSVGRVGRGPAAIPAALVAAARGVDAGHDVDREIFGEELDTRPEYPPFTEALSRHLRSLYITLCDGEPGLGSSDLLRFLREEQGQKIQLPKEETIENVSSETTPTKKRWSYEQWLAFMLNSGAFDALEPVDIVGTVASDTNRKQIETGKEEGGLGHPISSYFISTNYDFPSLSILDSLEYILRNGYRCISINVRKGDTPVPRASSAERFNFNSPAPSEPIATGRWTSPAGGCLFRDVCKLVAERGFETSSLPLIVNLIVACDLQQQHLMVQHMKEEWGEQLVDCPLSDCNPATRQPRLYELLNRILVQVIPNESKLDKALSDLGVYTRFLNVVEISSQASNAPSHVYKLGEHRILGSSASKASELQAHTETSLLHAQNQESITDDDTYHNFSPTKLDDPKLFRSKLVQMAVVDRIPGKAGVMINRAMFEDTGGWVLRPKTLRPINHGLAQETPPKPKALSLYFRTYATQGVKTGETFEKARRPIGQGGMIVPLEGNFFLRVNVQLHGVGQDGMTGSFGQSTDSCWKGKEVKFLNIRLGEDSFDSDSEPVNGLREELGFVRFVIEQAHNDSIVAWRAVRLDRLRSGWRLLSLYDVNGNEGGGLLLIHVKRKEFIAY